MPSNFHSQFRAIDRLSRLLLPVPAAVFLALWQWIAWQFPDTRFFFSSPEGVGMALWAGLASGELLRHAGITAFETVAGFMAGTASGACIGLALWYWPLVGRIARPYVVAVGAIPVFAVAPMVIIWFGIDVFAKVMVATLSTFFVAVNQAYQGACSVDERYLRLIAVLGGTRSQAFRKVVAPTALQWVLNAMRLNAGFALAGAFIGEFIASESGLGYFILRAASLFDTSRVLAGCVVLIAFALTMNAAVDLIERRLNQVGGS